MYFIFKNLDYYSILKDRKGNFNILQSSGSNVQSTRLKTCQSLKSKSVIKSSNLNNTKKSYDDRSERASIVSYSKMDDLSNFMLEDVVFIRNNKEYKSNEIFSTLKVKFKRIYYDKRKKIDMIKKVFSFFNLNETLGDNLNYSERKKNDSFVNYNKIYTEELDKKILNRISSVVKDINAYSEDKINYLKFKEFLKIKKIKQIPILVYKSLYNRTKICCIYSHGNSGDLGMALNQCADIVLHLGVRIIIYLFLVHISLL